MGGFQSYETDADVTSSSSYTTEDEDSDKDLQLMAGVQVTPEVVFGVGVHYHAEDREEKSTYTSTNITNYETKSSESILGFKVAVAGKLQNNGRIAVAYQPRTVKKFKVKEKQTLTDSNGTVINQAEQDDAEIMVLADKMNIAYTHPINNIDLIFAFTRYFPYTEKHEVTYTTTVSTTATSSTTSSSDGANILTVGGDMTLSKQLGLMGSLHYWISEGMSGQGLGLGADIAAGPLEITPGFSYTKLKFDYDDGDDIDGSRTVLSLAAGTTF
jgi:hypothetical protein